MADPCAQLARLISTYGQTPKVDLAMLWAYFDETSVNEIDDTAQMIVGGCVSSFEKWEMFSRKWRKVLNGAGVREFNAKHFYGFNGDFGWFKGNGQRDHRRHNKFRDKLADLITEYADELIAFTSQVSIERRGRHQAYEDAALRSLYEFTKGRCDGCDSVYIVLAQHPEYSPWSVLKKFEVIDWGKKLAGCGIFNPKDVLPLQAADFVLHAANRRWKGEETLDFLRLKDGCERRGKQFHHQTISTSDVRSLNVLETVR